MKLLQCLRNREKYRKSVYGDSHSSSTNIKTTKKKVMAPRKINISKESPASEDDIRDAMKKELDGGTVHIEVLKPLMTATFNSRQLNIGETAIAEVLQLYPALRKPAIVS